MEQKVRSEYARLTLLASYWYHRAWEGQPAGKEPEMLPQSRKNWLERAKWYDMQAHKHPYDERDMEIYTTLYRRWCIAGKTTLAALALAKTQEGDDNGSPTQK